MSISLDSTSDAIQNGRAESSTSLIRGFCVETTSPVFRPISSRSYLCFRSPDYFNMNESPNGVNRQYRPFPRAISKRVSALVLSHYAASSRLFLWQAERNHLPIFSRPYPLRCFSPEGDGTKNSMISAIHHPTLLKTGLRQESSHFYKSLHLP
jgi:hypothetical protein